MSNAYEKEFMTDAMRITLLGEASCIRKMTSCENKHIKDMLATIATKLDNTILSIVILRNSQLKSKNSINNGCALDFKI